MTNWEEFQAETKTGATAAPDFDVDLSRDRVATKPATASAERAIGQAHLAADGSILMHLGYAAGAGMLSCDIKYAPANPMYNRILSHLGGLKQGDTRMVKPFDTGSGSDSNLIGQASLDLDKSIKVSINSSKADHYKGDQIVYRPSNPYYSVVLEHLGNIKPGQTVALNGWVDR